MRSLPAGANTAGVAPWGPTERNAAAKSVTSAAMMHNASRAMIGIAAITEE